MSTNIKYTIKQYVALHHAGWNFTKTIRDGRNVRLFDSKEEAQQWIDAHPFLEDPNDVIRTILYKIERFVQP